MRLLTSFLEVIFFNFNQNIAMNFLKYLFLDIQFLVIYDFRNSNKQS